MSGVSAAKKLKDLGYTNFEIIEGSSRVGGRVYHRALGDYTVEFGPMTVHAAENNPVQALLTKYNVSIYEIDYDDWIVRARNGTDITEEADAVYEERFDPAVEKLETITDPVVNKYRSDFTLQAAFMKAGWEPNSFLDDVIEYFEVDWLYGYGPEETSAKFGTFYEMSTAADQMGEYMVKDERGFSVIVQDMLAEVLGNETGKLKLNKVVSTIEEEDGQITVTTDNGETYMADYVIVTFSLGVLQSNAITFKPALPEWKTDSIQQFQIAQYTTIYAQFPVAFWDDNEWILYAGDTDGLNLIFNMNRLYPGSNILNLEASNRNALRLERLTNNEVMQEVVTRLQDIYSSSNIVVPPPVNFTMSRYSQHPLYRGAWSNWPPGYSRDNHYALQAPVNRIYFAGEHAHFEFYGYLHGAYHSGQETGKELDNCIQRGVCEKYRPSYAARGCRYTAASNYDIRAKEEDGSCEFSCISGSTINMASLLTLLTGFMVSLRVNVNQEL